MKPNPLVTASAVLLVIVSVCFAQARRPEDIPKPSPPPQPSRGTHGNSRESLLKRKFESLLPGIRVTEEDLQDVDESQLPDSYVMLHIRWQTVNPNAPELTELPIIETEPGPPSTARLMKVLSRKKGRGQLGRPRAMDLSSDRLLYVAVDASQRLRHWYIVADPRVVTTEVPPGPGITGPGRRVFHVSRAEFYIGYPDDPSITELRFYHPRWNGAEYVLELAGLIRL
jgi:hypothetical protein